MMTKPFKEVFHVFLAILHKAKTILESKETQNNSSVLFKNFLLAF